MDSNEYWLIDTDYSYDDQLAISYLINKVKIVAITINSINTQVSANQIKTKIENDLNEKYNRSDIKVYCGSDRPFIDYHKEYKDDSFINPYDYIKTEYPNETDENDLININLKLSNVAALRIIEYIKLYEKKLKILTLGPLTNLSLAILLDASIKDKFNQLYIAGGTFTNSGNTGTNGEYNMRIDPIASKNVINYYNNITLLPIEIEHGFDLKNSCLGLIAAIVATNIQFIKKNEERPCDVDIYGRLSRGGLIISKFEYTKFGSLNEVNIVEEVDSQELKKLVNSYI